MRLILLLSFFLAGCADDPTSWSEWEVANDSDAPVEASLAVQAREGHEWSATLAPGESAWFIVELPGLEATATLTLDGQVRHVELDGDNSCGDRIHASWTGTTIEWDHKVLCT